ARFQGSAVRRAKWEGIVRNALIVAGNSGNQRYLPLIERYLQHPNPLLREHAEWAHRRLTESLPAAESAPHPPSHRAEG
ncbi:MAG: hypothetical protein SNJ72_11355, partial [Fimbriimonadales bacterium]